MANRTCVLVCKFGTYPQHFLYQLRHTVKFRKLAPSRKNPLTYKPSEVITQKNPPLNMKGHKSPELRFVSPHEPVQI